VRFRLAGWIAFLRSFVGRFHQSGTASCHYVTTHPDQTGGQMSCRLVKRIPLGNSAAPKHRYAKPARCARLQLFQVVNNVPKLEDDVVDLRLTTSTISPCHTSLIL